MVQQVKNARGREFPQNRVKMRAKQSDVIALKRTSEVPWCRMRNPRHRPSPCRRFHGPDKGLPRQASGRLPSPFYEPIQL